MEEESTHVVVGRHGKLLSGLVGQLARSKPREKSPLLGGQAMLQAVTRVKLEQASKACACGIRPRGEGTYGRCWR